MTPRRYTSAAAFKQALEQRLRTLASTGPNFTRRRQLLVFDRFLARIVQSFGNAAVLKGGLVLELRLHRARTTKDIDLGLMGSSDDLLDRLRQAGTLDLGDFMLFEVQPDAHRPEIQNEGMRYQGLRFRARCKLTGKIYGQPFGVDMAFGDPFLGEPDVVVANDLLGFAGIEPPELRLYPIETHIAEKLHAYTLPRTRLNTRVKDLPDLALLAMTRKLNSRRVGAALNQTFTFRGTHPLPDAFPAPLVEWIAPYAAMAREDDLRWRTLDEVTAAVRAFLDFVLGSQIDAVWDPVSWTWKPANPGSTDA